MANNSVRNSVVVALASAAGMLCVYACKVDDENPGTARRDGGQSTPDGQPSAEGSPGTGGSCTRLGGASAVATIADGVLAKVRADCRLSATFANVQPDGEQHLKECFAIQMEVFFRCPGVSYPANDSLGDPCRSLTEAHQNLGLTSTDFQAFLDDAQAELTARGLTTAETREIASAFLGTRTAIVATETQFNSNCTCTDGKYQGVLCTPDAGTSDAGDSGSDG